MHNIYFTTEAAYEAVKEELWSNGAKYPRPLIVDVIETGKVYFDDNEEHFGTVNATVTDGTVKATVNGAEVALPYKGSVGEAVVLEVAPDDGKKFDKWSDGNMDNPRTVTVIEADKVFEAECVDDATPMYLTFEGAVDLGTGTPMLMVQYPENCVFGSGLEWSIEEVPTTWTPAVDDFGEMIMPGMETIIAGGYTKLHVRAKDGGNTKVAGLIVGAKKVSGPIISMLDNTGSITSMPDEAFHYDNGADVETGFFMYPEIAGAGFVEDISGMIFPDFVSECCYQSFAHGFVSLITPPAELPAVEPTEDCYYCMFDGCTNLAGDINVKMSSYRVEVGPEEYVQVGDSMTGTDAVTLHVPSDGYEWAQMVHGHVIDPDGEYWFEG